MTTFCTNLQGTYIHQELMDTYSLEIATFLLSEIEKMESGSEDPFTDNYRFCDIANEEQYIEFLYRKSNSGPGKMNKKVVHESGTYLIGFN